MHRARAALAVIAAFLRAGEGDSLANTIQQRRARIDSKVVVFAVNPQRDWDSSLAGNSPCNEVRSDRADEELRARICLQRNLYQCGVPRDNQHANGRGYVG